MHKTARTPRKYDSTRRQAHARQTRRSVLDAAYAEFREHGYAGATMQAVAARAGVSLQTIYAIFENKPRLLVALFNAYSAAPSEENTPVPERAGPRAAERERDPRRQLQMFAQVVADNLEGAAPVGEIMADAARSEPEIARILARLNAQRVEHVLVFVRRLHARGPFRDDMDIPSAGDIVWALASPELFLMLTRERGWSKDRYRDWLSAALARELLP